MCLTGTGQCTMYLSSPHRVSPSSCQHFSRLVNDSRLCNGTAQASTFFTRRQLLSLDPGAKPCRLDPVILSRLKDLGIARNLLRKRSKGGGRRKQRRIPVLITSRDGCSFVGYHAVDVMLTLTPLRFLGHSSWDSAAVADAASEVGRSLIHI